MNSSIISDILLPASLALIMFGMGLGLSKNDFTRLWLAPHAVLIGLVGQLIFLPIIALSICVWFGLSPTLAVGLMILAASPGGTTSNIFSQLARANVALSVTLTAICTIICIISTPWVIHYSLQFFSAEAPSSYSLVGISIGLMIITLLPVLLGLTTRHFFQQSALKCEPYFRRFSLLLMVFLIVALVIKEHDMLIKNFESLFWACFLLNVASISIGVFLAIIMKLDKQDAITLGIEVGIQNATMAMLISISFLQNPEYAISSSVYGLVMFFGVIPLVWWSKRHDKQATPQRLD